MALRYYQEEAVDSLFDYFASRPTVDEKGWPVRSNPLVAMPTGTGKSHVIAEFSRRAMVQYPDTRIFMGTHVKELIEQNANKLRESWPLAPLGIYSAGLNKREANMPIVFGGIQSSVGKFPLFGRRDLLIIDEAHLLSPNQDTRYSKFIRELMGLEGFTQEQAHFINPYLKVIGLTATPYRIGLGPMTNGGIFTHIVYNLCTIEGFTRLIAQGYLAPLIPRPTQTTLDVSGVSLSNGEFVQSQLQAAVDKSEVTYAALEETVRFGYDRRSWLLFASGVEHANHIGEMLNDAFGIPTVVIHSKKTDAENAKSLRLWKTGKVRAAVNMNSLTTGVDHPACDLIGMYRPTMSTGLWVQMLGRGTRPYDSTKEKDAEIAAAFPGVKLNCLVLDFAGNTRRLGPINDPVIPRPKGSGPPGDAPVKICKACGCYNHTSARECVVCGVEFPTNENIDRTASTDELIRSELPQIEHFDVQRVILSPHTSNKTQRNSIKVSYYCKGAVPRTFYEYISMEAEARFFRHKSHDWFRQRYHYSGEQYTWGDSDVPATNAELLAVSQELRHPRQIRVWLNRNPSPEILGYEF